MCAGSLVLGLALPAPGHVLLDPDVAEGLIAEIARFSKESRKGPEADEALYRLGVTVEALVGLMNQDAAAHGQSDFLVQLIVKQLEANQVAVRVRDGRFEYDLAAFREYLRRAPSGPRAVAARFRLIAQAFHRSTGDDPLRTDGADVTGLRSAIEEEERFLHDYSGPSPCARIWTGAARACETSWRAARAPWKRGRQRLCSSGSRREPLARQCLGLPKRRPRGCAGRRARSRHRRWCAVQLFCSLLLAKCI